MSRLNEMQEMNITRRIQILESRLMELKLTPQPTSNRSGVLTYQVPANDIWQTVEWTDHLGVVRYTDTITLEPTPQSYELSRVEFEYTYTPKNQNNPIVYPFLYAQIDGVEWIPFYSPSLGMGFNATASQSKITYYYDAGENKETTNYSFEKPTYSWFTTARYSTQTSSHNPILKVKFRLRSTDTGTVSVKVKSYKDF